MLLSELDANNITDKMIDDVLFDFPADDGKNADFIWVFGSLVDLDERVNYGVKLYNEKRAPKILFSGGMGKNGVQSEAIIMRNMAIELGVPEQDIWVETDSNNTTENILASLLVIERKILLQDIKRIIIVTSILHMKRVILTLERYLPKWIELTYSTDQTSIYRKDNWKNDNTARIRMSGELRRLIYYAKDHYCNDTEIKSNEKY